MNSTDKIKKIRFPFQKSNQVDQKPRSLMAAYFKIDRGAFLWTQQFYNSKVEKDIFLHLGFFFFFCIFRYSSNQISGKKEEENIVPALMVKSSCFRLQEIAVSRIFFLSEALMFLLRIVGFISSGQ